MRTLIAALDLDLCIVADAFRAPSKGAHPGLGDQVYSVLQRSHRLLSFGQDDVSQQKLLGITVGDTKGADFKANTEGPAGSIFAGGHALC